MRGNQTHRRFAIARFRYNDQIILRTQERTQAADEHGKVYGCTACENTLKM